MAEFELFIGNKCISSWSLRPWVAMRHIGLPFTEHLVRLRTPETAAHLSRISPTGQVPVLVHDGRQIWESLAILEYLAELSEEPRLWPDDVGARAWARSVSAEMQSGFRDLRNAWPMNLRRRREHRPLAGRAEANRLRVERIWRECRDTYASRGPFLFGPFTAADAMYAPMATRFVTYGGELDPLVRDYVDAVLAMPAMRQWYAEAAAEIWPEPGEDE